MGLRRAKSGSLRYLVAQGNHRVGVGGPEGSGVESREGSWGVVGDMRDLEGKCWALKRNEQRISCGG